MEKTKEIYYLGLWRPSGAIIFTPAYKNTYAPVIGKTKEKTFERLREALPDMVRDQEKLYGKESKQATRWSSGQLAVSKIIIDEIEEI